jgi:L-threonylcarbamoyladenylate synthase
VIGRRTLILPVDPSAPEPSVVRQAAEVLRTGGLVAFPTETVYGLGANALDSIMVRRIFEAKGRPATNPLIVHVCDEAMLRQVVAEWPALARDLAERFWPGPLTIVLPKNPAIPEIVTGGGPTVAVRMPSHPVALALMNESRMPLAAPSANRSSELSPTTAEHVWKGLEGRIDLILDAGPTQNGIESTVMDLTTDPPTLLRPGPIGVAELEEIMGPIQRGRIIADAGPLPSPGLMERHYAPKTPLELFASRSALDERASALMASGQTVKKVLLGGVDHTASVMPTNHEQYAARLFAELHYLDSLWLNRILIEMPPDTDDWLAVRDRLTRAAAKGS